MLKGGKQMMGATPVTEENADMENPPGASSHNAGNWHTIHWQKVERKVRRLQARIVQATQQGRWGKVKALQHLLTHSYSGKALAVKRVTENQGKRTPGGDGETWQTPEKKGEAISTLKQRGYHPRPLRRMYRPKKNGKLRPLGIPCMKDRAMQALYLLALDPIAETLADPNSYGFRPGRSPADAIDQCFKILNNAQSAQWVLEGDIKACFDHMSHQWLFTHIPMEKSILSKWLKAGYLEKHVLHPTEEGTPQGGMCSPVLANLTLDGLERRLQETYPKTNKKRRAAKVNFVRCADDFIITGNCKEVLEQEIPPLVECFMKERGLTLSPEKTIITHIEEGCDVLGQHIRKYPQGKQYKLLITPSKKNVQTFLEKIRETIKTNTSASAGTLILQLNPKIRGWANYHRHVVSSNTFKSVDRAIYQRLWQWAQRRHRNTSAQWIKRKYFHSLGNNKWVFSGEIEGKEGKTRMVRLFYAASLPIERHIKIKGNANPYDPQWEISCEERLGSRMAHHLQGRRTLRYLWEQQQGMCPICQQKMTTITGWHNHHIISRSRGGSDQTENRVLLHPNCHRQVHSQRLNVVKPRPAKGVRKA
jgi:RNA-directed DNA polymerase